MISSTYVLFYYYLSNLRIAPTIASVLSILLSILPSSRLSDSWIARVSVWRSCWVFNTGGCSGRGVQGIGAVLYNQLVYNII